jgi:hypothetical protein
VKRPFSILLAVWLFRRLTFVLPSPFRKTYGSMIAQDFALLCRDAHAQSGVWGVAHIGGMAIWDLIIGAWSEYLALVARLWKGTVLMQRQRTSLIIIFSAYIAFVIAGIALQKMTEYEDFTSLAQSHPAVGIPYAIVYYGSAVSLLAVLIGGVPLALVVLRQAFTQKRWGIAALFAVPPVALGAFIGFAIMLTKIQARSFQTTGLPLTVVAFMLAAIVSTSAVGYAIAHSDVNASLYRFARWPAIVTTATMIIMFVATLTFGVSANATSPHVLSDLFSYKYFTWLNVTILMAVASIVASVGAVRLIGQRPSVTLAA